MPAPRRRGAPGLRLARLPLLLAYLLVLLGTPVGEAGFRWMHLATAHSAPASLPGAEPTDLGSAVRGAPPVAPSAAAETRAHRDAHDGHAAHEHAHSHEREDASAHPHAVTPERDARIAIADVEPEGGSLAPDQPHEHGGKIHTHRQHPAPDAEMPAGALSKYYLSPPTTSAPATAPAARHASHLLPAPHAVAARIDTPPPRLPG